jgi:hypothetical protein
MEEIMTPATDIDNDRDAELVLHAWRAEQLRRLGLHGYLAEEFADRIDWHAFAKLVERGCTPALALEIVRP